jgi:integrase
LTFALKLAMRDAEIRSVQIQYIDWNASPPILTVTRSKTAAGEGRRIPLRPDVQDVLSNYLKWYAGRFGSAEAGWFLFPFGKSGKLDPTRPVTTLKTAWKNIKTVAGVQGRWHDARHTRITELAEAGAGDATIMQIAGHVSKQMLARYSHIRVRAMDDALAKADETTAATAKREQNRRAACEPTIPVQ